MTSSKEHHRGRGGLTALMAASAIAAVTALAGCNSTATSDVDLTPYDYRLRHPILISDEPEVFKIPVGMKGPALSPEIETALYDYVTDYQANGTGGITIQPPTGSANEMAAAETGRAVHYALVSAGVPRSITRSRRRCRFPS
jgi:pilus assembly protein CpaD